MLTFFSTCIKEITLNGDACERSIYIIFYLFPDKSTCIMYALYISIAINDNINPIV